MHAEVPVKVTAYVDEGIAPLVEALNKIPGLYTLDSCEAGADGMAYCFAAYRGPVSEFVCILSNMAGVLRDRVGGCCEFKISLEWIPGDDTPLAKITSQHEMAGTLAGVLSDVAAMAAHTKPSLDDS